MAADIGDDTFSLGSSTIDEVDDLGLFNETGFWGEGQLPPVGSGVTTSGDKLSDNRKESDGGDNFLSALLLDQQGGSGRSEAIRNMSATVRVRQSFRKRSSAASVLSRDPLESTDDGNRRSSEENVASSSKPDEPVVQLASVLGKEVGSSRSRRRLAQLVDAWVSSSTSAENVNRVRHMKDLLSNHPTIACEFLREHDDTTTDTSMVGTPELDALTGGSPPPAALLGAVGASDSADVQNGKSGKAGKGSSATGGAYRMLEEVLTLRRNAAADSKAAQAFEVIYAAASVATDWPSPLPHVVHDVLEAVLCSEWRPPLASFFALRLIIALSPPDAMAYCRRVLHHCLHFQFRVVDAAMVCVAEEAIEGTLTNAESWVMPVLAVIRFVTSTAMSAELLMLSVDILSYTFSCGCAATFVQEGGVLALSEALLVVEADPAHREIVGRVLKLLNPQAMLTPPSGSFEVSMRRRQQDVLSTSRLGDNPLISGQFVAFQEDPTPMFVPPQLTTEHHRQILAALLSVLQRFSQPHATQSGRTDGGGQAQNLPLQKGSSGPTDEGGQLVEDCSVVLFAIMRMSLSTCIEDGAVPAFCRTIAMTPHYWTNKVAMRAAVSIVQTFLSTYHSTQESAGGSPPRDILTESSQAVSIGTTNVASHAHTAHSYKLTALSTVTTSSAASPNFYRPIMDSAILAMLSVSLRCFYLEDVSPNSMMAHVYRVIHTTCLTEPAKQCFLRGCGDDDDEVSDDDDSDASSDGIAIPSANALVPSLLYCLSRTTMTDHQRYCLTILSRLCRASPKDFCPQLLGQLPAGTLQTGFPFQKGPKHSVSGGLLHAGVPVLAVKPPTEDAPTPAGAVCRFLAKRLGTWNPQLIPIILGLCREVARFFTHPYSQACFHRGACEALFASIQSCVASFSTDPNIVASGCMVLGHLCRCPHTYHQTALNSAPSSMHMAAMRTTWLDTSMDTTPHDVPSPSRARSASVTSEAGGRVHTLLRYALEHDVVDLAISLSHGRFAEVQKMSAKKFPELNGSDREGDELRPVGSRTMVGPPPGEGNDEETAPADAVNGSAGTLVLSQKLPILVKAAVAYLSAGLASDADIIPTLRDEGLLSIMQYISDMYSKHNQHQQAESVPESPRANAQGASAGSPGQRTSSTPSLLSREDKEFVKKQLTTIHQHLKELAASQHDEGESLPTTPVATGGKPPHARQGSGDSASMGGGAKMPSVNGGGGVLDVFWRKQQGALLSEFEKFRVTEMEDELHHREALKSQFFHRLSDLQAKQLQSQMRLKQERLDLELRCIESQRQIEQFQSEQFMEMVSYSHRSLQKKLTTAMRTGNQRLSIVSPIAPSLTRAHSDVYQHPNRHTAKTMEFGDTTNTVFVSTNGQLDDSDGLTLCLDPGPAREPRELSNSGIVDPTRAAHRLSPSSASGLQPQQNRRASDQGTMSATERDALAQLEQLKLEMGIQATSSLATLMQTITATYNAVKQLQVQHDAMTREFAASPPPLPTHHGTAPRSATPTGWGGAAAIPTRPMSAPQNRGCMRGHRPRGEGTPTTCGDDGIYEDRSPSPSNLSTRPIPATPPPRTRPHTAATAPRGGPMPPFRSRLLADTDAPIQRRSYVVDATAGTSLTPQGHLEAIQEQLSDAIAREGSIASLNLNRAYLGDAGLASLLPLIAKLPSLRQLCLQCNGVSSTSLVPLLSSIAASIPSLEHLDVSFNRDITPRNGRDLLSFVKTMPTIRCLDTEGTQLFLSTRRILESILDEREQK